MLQFFLMLFGLAIPNSNAHTQNVNGDQTEVSQTQDNTDQNSDNNQDDDTGGEDAHIPPKK